MINPTTFTVLRDAPKDGASPISMPTRISATPYIWREPSNIPKREWLFGTHLIRRFLSATIAHPGVGKTYLATTEAISMVTCRNLLGIQPEKPLRVWLWNGEDPREEIERRIAAICIHYGIKRDEFCDRLFLDSGRDTEIIIATQGRNGVVIADPVVDDLIKEILKNKIDVLQVDPYVSTHRLSENDNAAMDAASKKWNYIANVTGIAIDLFHHSKKTGGGEVSVEDSRGASALIATVRSARTLNTMTETESAKFGVMSRRRFFRVDNGKANLAAPSEKASWFEIKSVMLGNGDPADLADAGDSVGVVVPWAPTSPLDGVTGDHFNRVAQDIRAARWRENHQARDWVGNVVAGVLGLDVKISADKARVVGILKHWIAAGSLRVVDGLDEKRMTRKYIEVSDALDD